MKNLFLIIMVLLAAQLKAQTVTITPQKPQRGDTIHINFDPTAEGSKIPDTVKSVTIVFTYSTFYDLPWKMAMTKVGKLWTASFAVQRYATFATFYLQSGNFTEKPGNAHFEIPVYKGNVREKSSQLHQSYSLSTQNPKAADLQLRKKELIKGELKDYPASYEGKLALLNVEMALAKNATQKQKLRNQARKLIAAKFDENPTLPGNVNLVTMGYLMIGEKSRLDSVRKIIMQRYPKADISIDLKASLLAKEKDSSLRAAKLEELLQQSDQTGEEGSASVHNMLFDYYASIRDSVKALQHIAKLAAKETPYTAQNLRNIAAKLTQYQIAPYTANAYADRALKLVNKWPVGIIRYFPEFGYIPSFVPDSVRQNAIHAATEELQTIKLLNKYQLGAKKTAVDSAIILSKTITNDQALLNLASLFESSELFEPAFEMLWTVLQHNPTNQSVQDRARQDFLKYNNSDAGFQFRINELEQLEITRLKTKLKGEMLNKAKPELSALTDLNGNLVTADMMKGKIVIMDFWATWCVPCMEEMPYFHKVFQKFRNNADVMFMVVNSGANNTLKDAQKWAADNPQYQFPIYFNHDKNIGEKVGFTLIPTIAVLDKDGKMQFRTIGFEGAILEKKLTAEIDILLAK